MAAPHIVVVGAGVFGLTAAIELVLRGSDVTLVDPGPIPHPLAESTDISKAVRMDYGKDELYAAEMEIALDGWRAWNARWTAPLFHEAGVTYLCRSPMRPGGFEHDSYEVLRRRGHHPERLDSRAIKARFPAWNSELYVDGYYNAEGGYAESGKVISALARDALAGGVTLVEGFRFARLLEHASRVVGIADVSGAEIRADRVVVAAGGWTPYLLPHLAPHLRTVGQPVFHLAPRDVALFSPERFPTFGADIAETGYYGFPANAQGIVKVANHGPGRAMTPDDARTVTRSEEEGLREFLRVTFPLLADAPLAGTRVCVYCDTRDEHFLIAPDPEFRGLIVATGGSGHAFKFAPRLGKWIADAVEGAPNPVRERFRWRPDLPTARGEEAARHRG